MGRYRVTKVHGDTDLTSDVDIKLKVAFYYRLLILKGNFLFDVNKICVPVYFCHPVVHA